eukprot:m.239506 g.239506  ORF g.239506 m.239506 type:complete len:790 (-) comp22615_c0_seq1:29-2398(-)
MRRPSSVSNVVIARVFEACEIHHDNFLSDQELRALLQVAGQFAAVEVSQLDELILGELAALLTWLLEIRSEQMNASAIFAAIANKVETVRDYSYFSRALESARLGSNTSFHPEQERAGASGGDADDDDDDAYRAGAEEDEDAGQVALIPGAYKPPRGSMGSLSGFSQTSFAAAVPNPLAARRASALRLPPRNSQDFLSLGPESGESSVDTWTAAPPDARPGRRLSASLAPPAAPLSLAQLPLLPSKSRRSSALSLGPTPAPAPTLTLTPASALVPSPRQAASLRPARRSSTSLLDSTPGLQLLAGPAAEAWAAPQQLPQSQSQSQSFPQLPSAPAAEPAPAVAANGLAAQVGRLAAGATVAPAAHALGALQTQQAGSGVSLVLPQDAAQSSTQVAQVTIPSALLPATSQDGGSGSQVALLPEPTADSERKKSNPSITEQPALTSTSGSDIAVTGGNTPSGGDKQYAANLTPYELARIRELFKLLDVNNSGTLSRDEFMQIKRLWPLRSDDTLQSKLETIFLQMDANGDQTITRDEFISPRSSLIVFALKLLTPAQARHYVDIGSSPRVPWFLFAISLVQLVCFIAFGVALGGVALSSPDTGGQPLAFDPTRKQQAWRFASYSLLHNGVGHIAVNLLQQCLVGLPIEMAHGSLRVAALYVAGVTGAALGHSLSLTKAPLVGASGGVYALIALWLADIIINFRELPMLWFRLPFITLLIGANAGLSAIASDPVPQAIVHLTGFGVGLNLGLALLDNIVVVRWERIVRSVTAALVAVFFSVAIAFNIFTGNA